MSGKERVSQSGQLALMDAMVFFAIAAVISAVLMSNAITRSTDSWDSAFDSPPTDDLLAVFLRASVGHSISLDGTDMVLTGRERWADALAAVSEDVMGGQDPAYYSGLLSQCGEVLTVLCEPWSPTLRLSFEEDGRLRTLVEVGGPPPEGGDTYAASQDLSALDETKYVATLVLFPALAPHALRV